MTKATISPSEIIAITKNWVAKIVIGLNLCPFAKPVFDSDSIRYLVTNEKHLKQALQSEFTFLNNHDEFETTLIVIADGLTDFEHYLDALDECNELLQSLEYEGIYQLASFHPDYIFEGSGKHDPANYTNRSPYPLLHILREDSLDDAVASHRNVEDIPTRNIQLTRKLGEEKLQAIIRQK